MSTWFQQLLLPGFRRLLSAIGGETLPSDFLLQQMHFPLFHLAFQAMILAALLESGTGAVHAINERIANLGHSQHGGENEPKVQAAERKFGDFYE